MLHGVFSEAILLQVDPIFRVRLKEEEYRKLVDPKVDLILEIAAEVLGYQVDFVIEP